MNFKSHDSLSRNRLFLYRFSAKATYSILSSQLQFTKKTELRSTSYKQLSSTTYVTRAKDIQYVISHLQHFANMLLAKVQFSLRFKDKKKHTCDIM